MQNNSKFTWKYHSVTVTAPDGVVLNGQIKYWAKDYSTYLLSPIKVHGCGGHLQYGIPAVYVVDEPKRKGVVQLDLKDGIERLLLNLYEEKKEDLDALDVQGLIDEGYFDIERELLLQTVCKAWNVSDIDILVLNDTLTQRNRKQLKGEI